MQGCGSTSAGFEGTEKKLELIVAPSVPSLRGFGDAYWTRIARRAGADILSRLDGDACTAYLLSESSLFVFDHQVIMMTCGRTTLHDAAVELLERVPPDQVRMCFYQRKNEVFPHDQPTSFFDDVRRLGAVLPGKAFQFGHEDEHHLYLYHLDRDFTVHPEAMTVEILMYGLDPEAREHFSRRRHPTTAGVREMTGVHRLIPGFDSDDHLFEPTGYSLNAVRGAEYFAVHVTPEDVCSYASFETNHRVGAGLGGLVRRVIDVFRPRSYDLVLFDRAYDMEVPSDDYRLGVHVSQTLDVGKVRFLSYRRPPATVRRAVPIPVAGG